MTAAPVYTVDGTIRRVCDLIAGSPWSATVYRQPGFHRGIPTQVLQEMNTALCARLLKHRVPVIFADAVAESMRWSRDYASGVIRETPGVMCPFPTMMIDARNSAAKEGHDFIGYGVWCVSHAQLAKSPGEDAKAIDMHWMRFRDTALEFLAEHRRPEVLDTLVLSVWVQTHEGAVWGPLAESVVFIDQDHRVMVVKEAGDIAGSPESREIRDAAEALNKKVQETQRQLDADERHAPSLEAITSMRSELEALKVRLEKAVHLKPGDPMVITARYATIRGYESDEYHGAFVSDAIQCAVSTAIRTIGLMNASNVRYVDGGVTNKDVSVKRRDRDRLAMIRYHVLELRAGTKWVPLEQRVAGGGDRPMPLHMVRGHFRDYSRGAGLFGRYRKQAVWVPAHVRGDAEDGVVQTDYQQEIGHEQDSGENLAQGG